MGGWEDKGDRYGMRIIRRMGRWGGCIQASCQSCCCKIFWSKSGPKSSHYKAAASPPGVWMLIINMTLKHFLYCVNNGHYISDANLYFLLQQLLLLYSLACLCFAPFPLSTFLTPHVCCPVISAWKHDRSFLVIAQNVTTEQLMVENMLFHFLYTQIHQKHRRHNTVYIYM